MESGGCRRSPSSPSSSRNYTEPHRLAPRGIAIAWSGECFPPAIPDLIYESQDVVQNQRLRLEQEHCQNDNTTPYRHCISYVELAVNLIDILPWTTLPPVAQALIYIENLIRQISTLGSGKHYRFIRDGEGGVCHGLVYTGSPEECEHSL